MTAKLDNLDNVSHQPNFVWIYVIFSAFGKGNVHYRKIVRR